MSDYVGHDAQRKGSFRMCWGEWASGPRGRLKKKKTDDRGKYFPPTLDEDSFPHHVSAQLRGGVRGGLPPSPVADLDIVELGHGARAELPGGSGCAWRSVERWVPFFLSPRLASGSHQPQLQPLALLAFGWPSIIRSAAFRHYDLAPPGPLDGRVHHLFCRHL